MLPVLTRSIARRTAVQYVRCMSQKTPTPPGKRLTPTAQETAERGAPTFPAADATKAAQQEDSGAQRSPLENRDSQAEAHEQSTPIIGLPTLDFSPPETEKEFKRTGAKSSKGSLSTLEKKRQLMSRISLVLLAMAFGAHTVYIGREWDDVELTERKMTRESAPSTRWGRSKERFNDLFDYFNKPAWPELLPPPYPPPHQKPYTLLLSLEDLLVTSTWDRKHGWRTAKRPGVDYFLAYISQFYEVVIFTTLPSYTGAPILEKLDRYGFFINHRLFRESTRSLDGNIVKDISYLNRDLSKVVLIDTHSEHVATHPENAIVLPKWKGEAGDRGLVAIIPFLESIAIYKPTDVRPILKAYEGKDIAIEYGKIEAEMKVKHIEEWKAKNKHAASPPSLGFGSLFGVSSAPTQSKAGPPLTYLEQKRTEAQKQYLEEQKYLADNKEELERLLEQDQQAMASQVPGSLWAALDQYRGTGPPPPPGAPNPAGTTGAPVGSVSAAVSASGSGSGPSQKP